MAIQAVHSGKLLTRTDQYGKFFTTSAGMTLYTYTADKPGGPGCHSLKPPVGPTCIQAWKPLELSAAQAKKMEAQNPGFGTYNRSGKLQLTYKGYPLYTFYQDMHPGQVKGEHFKDPFGEWFVATLSGQPKATSNVTKAPTSGGAAF